MIFSFRLLARRRFFPLFVTQFLNAFNDNLYKTAMVMLVTYQIFADPAKETIFNAVAGAVFILPFFLFSALSGQLADWRDKAGLIRLIKSAEILIMMIGAIGLITRSITLMLFALFAMGAHSTFFGPIKYAILPQHLHEDEVLPGTGLVEAGTYIAILAGTIVGGMLQGLVRDGHLPDWSIAIAVVGTAIIGRMFGGQVPPAPPEVPNQLIDRHIIRSSITLIKATLHIPRLYLAIAAISFFWAMGTILAAQFPPLVKNVLTSDEGVATLSLSIFSVGVAVGSIAINRLLKGAVSARFAPASALVMGLFVVDLYVAVREWTPAPKGMLFTLDQFILMPRADHVMFALFGVAVAGGMFVVPLYAFLTTTVPKSETARTVAANNIINSGAMVASTLVLSGLVKAGLSVADSLLIVAVASIGAAALAYKLHRACDLPLTR